MKTGKQNFNSPVWQNDRQCESLTQPVYVTQRRQFVVVSDSFPDVWAKYQHFAAVTEKCILCHRRELKGSTYQRLNVTCGNTEVTSKQWGCSPAKILQSIVRQSLTFFAHVMVDAVFTQITLSQIKTT